MNPELVHQEHGDQKDAGRKEERDEVGDLIPVTPKFRNFSRTRSRRRGDNGGSHARTYYFIKAICFCSLTTIGLGSGA